MTARLTLFVFDVGHGDHLLLRVEDGAERLHAVIDCHWTDRRRDPPALDRLRAWEVDRLDLLVLTHPHVDHFFGLSRIARYFSTEGRRLERFMDPGIDLRLLADRRYPPRHPAHEELYALHDLTRGRRQRGEALPRCLSLRSPCSPTRVSGSVTLESIAPDRATWEDEHRALLEAPTRFRPNRLSAVLVWRVLERLVLLGTDLEEDGWTSALRDCAARGLDLDADVVKVGHHGAANAAPARFWETVVRPPPEATYAAISTRGTAKHPSRETLGRILGRGAHPRCTRWGPVCEPHVPASIRAVALSTLGARPRGRETRRRALTTLGARRLPGPGPRCFGGLQFEVTGPEVTCHAEVPGARCFLRAASAATQD